MLYGMEFHIFAPVKEKLFLLENSLLNLGRISLLSFSLSSYSLLLQTGGRERNIYHFLSCAQQSCPSFISNFHLLTKISTLNINRKPFDFFCIE